MLKTDGGVTDLVQNISEDSESGPQFCREAGTDENEEKNWGLGAWKKEDVAEDWN